MSEWVSVSTELFIRGLSVGVTERSMDMRGDEEGSTTWSGFVG